MLEEIWLQRLTYQEIDSAPRDKALIILPIGPLEAHGPHLPLGTDFFGAASMCELAAAKLIRRGLQPLLAPTLPYALADMCLPFTGTVTLRPTTLKAVVIDVISSLAKHRFRYFSLLCNHLEPANRAALNEAARELKETLGLEVLVSKTILKSLPVVFKALRGEHPQLDSHSGEMETAFCLWAFPELVKKEVLTGMEPNWINLGELVKQGARDFIEAGCPAGYFGDPRSATAELGEQLWSMLSENLTEEIYLWWKNISANT